MKELEYFYGKLKMLLLYFSYTFNGISAACILVSIFFKGLAWRHCKHVEIFDKKDKNKRQSTTHEETEGQELIIN